MDEAFTHKIEEIIQEANDNKCNTMQQKGMLRVMIEVSFVTKFAELQYLDFQLFYKD